MEHGNLIGQRIRAIRHRKKISASRLAHAAGVTENAIRKIESGDSKEPRFSTGVLIAKALGVKPEALLSGEVPQRDAVLEGIRRVKNELALLGVEHVTLFGSVARGDAIHTSDADLLVTLKPTAKMSLFSLAKVEAILENAAMRKVDVLTADGDILPSISQAIKREGILAF